MGEQNRLRLLLVDPQQNIGNRIRQRVPLKGVGFVPSEHGSLAGRFARRDLDGLHRKRGRRVPDHILERDVVNRNKRSDAVDHGVPFRIPRADGERGQNVRELIS